MHFKFGDNKKYALTFFQQNLVIQIFKLIVEIDFNSYTLLNFYSIIPKNIMRDLSENQIMCKN